MAGPVLERLGARPRHHLLDARRRVPRPRAQPAAAGEPAVHHRPGARGRGRPGDRLGRRRRPLLLHRRHGHVRRRRLPHGPPRPPDAGEGAGGDDPLRRPREPGRRRHGQRARAAPPTSTASGTPSSRPRCASATPSSAARSPATTTSATSGARTPGRSRRCSSSSCSRLRSAPCPSSSAYLRDRYFISGEINSEVADQEAKMKEIAELHADAEVELARRRLGRLPRLALQRAPVEHRAAAAPEPRVARLARGHGAEAGRGPRR